MQKISSVQFDPMDSTSITSRSLVSEMISLAPQTMPLLLHLRLGCYGCVMAKFCTVGEVASQYHLDLPVLLVRIQQAIDGNT